MRDANLRLSQIPTVKVGMLIRRPPAVVFQALVDPAITTRFWFTKSSGRLVPGANVEWDWEMFGVSTQVFVKEVEESSRILIERGNGDEFTTYVYRGVPPRGATSRPRARHSHHRGGFVRARGTRL
jgi:hypothetical protein